MHVEIYHNVALGAWLEFRLAVLWSLEFSAVVQHRVWVMDHP